MEWSSVDMYCVVQECSVCVKCSECVGLACECWQSDVTQREELLL